MVGATTRSETQASVRQTRSASTTASAVKIPPGTGISSAQDKILLSRITLLPQRLTTKTTRLPRPEQQLLLAKQSRLARCSLEVPTDFKQHCAAIESTLVFSQAEAGTAVCISPTGLILTCAHCIAETQEEFDAAGVHWLLFRSGRAVGARCIVWDERRDLALLQVISAQNPTSTPQHCGTMQEFPCSNLAKEPPVLNAHLVCIGHPGSEDLESSQAGQKTGYDILHISTGRFKGCAKGQDLQDNSEIGALQHNCWTYWGHSGAPLLCQRTGELVGLHSSWDDVTAMRRGVPHQAIAAFLEENAEKHNIRPL